VFSLLQREREREYCPYNPTLSGKSVCGNLLTCIPLFIESAFEVPLKKKKKEKNKKSEEKRKEKARG
jgi:hypothetical protein